MLYPLAFTILLIFAVDITSTLPQDGVVSATDITTVATVTSQCMTGKRVAGTCVKRERCDYGTAAIDFTLYRPRGYKLSCSSEDVCCPPQYLVQQDGRGWAPQNDVFDFDDDD